MEPASEKDLIERALQTARRLVADLQRDVLELAELPEGSSAARAAGEAARRVVEELQSVPAEDAA
jgi:hypothetical protein